MIIINWVRVDVRMNMIYDELCQLYLHQLLETGKILVCLSVCFLRKRKKNEDKISCMRRFLACYVLIENSHLNLLCKNSFALCIKH